MSILLNYFGLDHKSGDVNCDFFRAAALDTWKRIGFSRTKPRLRIHETTITQNLVYEFHLLQQYFPTGLRIYESTNESANGDDLEISIKNVLGGYFTFAVQAKILYHNIPQNKPNVLKLSDGRYKQFNHSVGTLRLNQIDLLLTYANGNGFIPLYLLYNYVFGSFQNNNFCEVDFDISQYGCSIVHAQYLKNNYALAGGNLSPNVKFTDLHPSIALPWFVLPCCFAKFSLGEIFAKLKIDSPSNQIKSFSEQELIDRFKWSLLQDISVKTKNGEPNIKRSDYLNEKPFFAPKFKIVIS